MKKMILLACAAIGLAACEKDNSCTDNTPPPNDNMIRFAPSIVTASTDPLSRTTITGSTAAWNNGDLVGIFSTEPAGSPATNVQFTYNGSSWSTTTPMYWSNPTTLHRFLGYYPYVSTNTDSLAVKLPFLSGQTGTIDATKDFLYSRDKWWPGVARPASPGPYEVGLTFTHAFTLVQLNINVTGFTTGTSLTNFILTAGSGEKLITSGATPSTINLATAVITAGTTANTVSVAPGTPPVLTSGAVTIYGLILPGTFTAPTLALTLKEGGATVNIPATLLGTTVFAPGTKYTYTVNVTRTGITISNLQITDWATGTGGTINPSV